MIKELEIPTVKRIPFVSHKYDISDKDYEIQYQQYRVITYLGDKINDNSGWRHCKYYNTFKGCLDAINSHRSWGKVLDKNITQGRALLGNVPQIRQVSRFRIVKREK